VCLKLSSDVFRKLIFGKVVAIEFSVGMSEHNSRRKFPEEG
jgi:hypothetical protein